MDLELGKRLRDLTGPILVTGHSGFKGTWLTLLLEPLGVPVVGLSLQPLPNSLFDRAKRTGVIPESFIDIRDLTGVHDFMVAHQPSAVIHMAAKPLVLESYKIPRETFETNVMGTVNVLDAAFRTDSVKAVVAVTTDKVYRNDNSARPFIESDALAGRDPYSASKVGTEAVVAAWQQIARVSGGPMVLSLRAGNVVGGGDWAEDRLIPELIRGFTTGAKIFVRNPRSTRPWQHVLDPLRGYIMALESTLSGEVFNALNFGPDFDSLSVEEVARIAAATWPNSTSIDFISHTQSGSLESAALQLSSNKAKMLLQWKPFWNQQQSIISTVKWWDDVLNRSIAPVEACRSDIEYMLSLTPGNTII